MVLDDVLRSKGSGVAEDLETLRKKLPALDSECQKLRQLFDQRLYFEYGELAHTMLISLDPRFVSKNVIFTSKEDPAPRPEDYHGVEFVHRAVYPLRSKIKPETYARMVELSADVLPPAEGLQWIRVHDDWSPPGDDTPIVMKCAAACHNLRCGNNAEAAQILEGIQSKFEEVLGIELPSHARFHITMASLMKAQDKLEELYSHGHLFLQYVSIDSLTQGQRLELAEVLGTALLCSFSQYDFGELLHHAVVQSLQGTTIQWIIDFLRAFNEGSFPLYDTAVAMHRPTLEAAGFIPRLEMLTAKMSRMALMDAAFNKGKLDYLSFQEIAERAHTSEDEVERLVVRSIAHGLLKARIDQTSHRVHVSWVKPRSLDKPRLESLVTQLEAWQTCCQGALDRLVQ